MPATTQSADAPEAQSVGLIIGAVAVTLLLAARGLTILSTAQPPNDREHGRRSCRWRSCPPGWW